MAWKLFGEQKGMRFSFTDCMIIAQMSLNGIDQLATFDEEFEKAGLSAVKK
jgi:predicted nucleic acid-binding protein